MPKATRRARKRALPRDRFCPLQVRVYAEQLAIISSYLSVSCPLEDRNLSVMVWVGAVAVIYVDKQEIDVPPLDPNGSIGI